MLAQRWQTMRYPEREPPGMTALLSESVSHASTAWHMGAQYRDKVYKKADRAESFLAA